MQKSGEITYLKCPICFFEQSPIEGQFCGGIRGMQMQQRGYICIRRKVRELCGHTQLHRMYVRIPLLHAQIV